MNREDKENQQFKADAGKAMPDLFEMGFANAIRLGQATMEYGAKKYTAHSWQHVSDGLNRYNRAGGRHRQDRNRDWLMFDRDLAASVVRSTDAESGLPHIAHEIFNTMAMAELAIDDIARRDGRSPNELVDELIAAMKEPPTDHKESPEIEIWGSEGLEGVIHTDGFVEKAEGAPIRDLRLVEGDRVRLMEDVGGYLKGKEFTVSGDAPYGYYLEEDSGESRGVWGDWKFVQIIEG